MSKNKNLSSNIISEDLCLNRLGAHLLQYFPLSQVQEILEDYREYLILGKERGASTEGLLQELSHPSHIRQELLKEMPSGRHFFLLWNGGWGTFLLFTLYVSMHSLPYHTTPLAVVTLLMGCISLSSFALLHGRARSCLELQLGTAPLKKSFWTLQLLPPFLTALVEYSMQQLLVESLEALPSTIGIWRIGPVINSVLCTLVALLGVLLIWILFQVRTRSIRYFPGAIHTLGTMFFLLDIRAILRSMNLDVHNTELMHREFLLPLCWYGAGLLLALLFCFALKTGRKEPPYGHTD